MVTKEDARMDARVDARVDMRTQTNKWMDRQKLACFSCQC